MEEPYGFHERSRGAQQLIQIPRQQAVNQLSQNPVLRESNASVGFKPQVCGGWYDNAPWENCCVDGHQCADINVGLGLEALIAGFASL